MNEEVRKLFKCYKKDLLKFTLEYHLPSENFWHIKTSKINYISDEVYDKIKKTFVYEVLKNHLSSDFIYRIAIYLADNDSMPIYVEYTSKDLNLYIFEFGNYLHSKQCLEQYLSELRNLSSEINADYNDLAHEKNNNIQLLQKAIESAVKTAYFSLRKEEDQIEKLLNKATMTWMKNYENKPQDMLKKIKPIEPKKVNMGGEKNEN